MAGMAKPLHVAIVIGATLCQRFDMVALRGQRDTSQPLTFDTKGITCKQGGPLGLQSPARDTLGRCRGFCPGFALMFAATARTVTHQHATAGVIAWF